MSRTASVRGAALWSMGGQYLVFATGFVVSVLISRFFLSPEEVGLYSVSLSAAMLVSVLQDFGITRYVAGETDLDDDKIRTCFSVSILFAVAVGLAILALAWPTARFYHDMRLFPLLAVIAASYLIIPFAIVPGALLQRELNFRALFVINVSGALANAAAALGFAASGFSAMSLAWGGVAAQLVRAILARRLSGRSMPFPLRLSGALPILRFGSGMSALYVSGAVGGRAPDLVIGRLIGIAATGLYSRASGLAVQLVTLVTGAVGGVFYPAFARIRDRGEDLAPPYLRVVAGYTAVTWPAMLFLAAAAEPIVLLLYGQRWVAVAPLLSFLALSEMVFPALPLHIEIPILTGRMRRLMTLNLIDTAASVATLAIGAQWGLVAAAASRIGYAALWYALYAGTMRRMVGFRWRDMLGVYTHSLAAGAATALPLLIVYARWNSPATIGLASLAACALAGCVAWTATIFGLRHPVRHEIAALAGTALQRLRRTPAEARPT